jgi:glycosyltransferase involved in cell wall biosynthesis
MNILLIPATDWLRHPVPSRHHHIFEILSKTDNVHVLQFDLYPENPVRKSNVVIHRSSVIPAKDMAAYYLLNLPFNMVEIAKIVKLESIDVVVICNIIPGLATFLIKRMGVKVVFDLKDMLPDVSAIYYRNSLASSLIKNVSEWMLLRVLKNVDHVIAVSMYLYRYLKGMGIKNVSLLTNGADLSIFKPGYIPESVNTEIVEKLKDADFVIGFVATIDKWIDFETVLKALKEASSVVKNIKLLVVGGKMKTDYFDIIKAHVKESGLADKVLFTGTVPHEQVPGYVNLMDVCLIPIRPELRLDQARCPDKLFEYFACGKPVLSTALSEVIRLGGEAVSIYDENSLTKNILEIALNENLRKSMGIAALEKSHKYDWKSVAVEYRKILQQVIGD